MLLSDRTCAEKAVMFRLQHPDGRLAHAIILPTGQTISAIWFVDGREQASGTFRTVDGAIRFLERELVPLEGAGWSFRTNHASIRH